MSPRTKKKRPARAAVAKPTAVELPALRGGPPTWAAAVALAMSIAAVTHPTLKTPFLLDDNGGIERNRSIISLWPLVGTTTQPGPLNPGKEMPSSGRPLANLSLALNYQVGGLNPIGYHIFSVILHFCSAMLLFAITRRTLRLRYFRGTYDASAGWLALAVALLWSLHPIQTEAITYISQRTELMMAFFYLATLYCSLRYWSEFLLPFREGQRKGSFRSTGWLILAVLACLCGMASKEAMVSAPVMVLLFERTFIAGSLKTSLKRSWPLYVFLAATWILLVYLCLGWPRPHSTGFNHGVGAVSWWLTQSKVLLMYLKLVVWPWPLLIHYLLPYSETFGAAWMYVVPVLLLVIGTLLLLWRNRPLGYLGTWFFAILSPTLVIPIITETAAERRVYLPLAALAVIFVVGTYLLIRRISNWSATAARRLFGLQPATLAMGSAVALLAIGFGVMSANRINTYFDQFDLWRQVLIAQPDNHIAHENMGHQLEAKGRISAAMTAYREAIRLRPDFAVAHNSLGVLLINKKAFPEAVVELKQAVLHDPTRMVTHRNLAAALFATGNLEASLAELTIAAELEPDDWATRRNMGMVLQKAGKHSESIESYRRALELRPNDLATYGAIATSFDELKQRDKAIETLEHGLSLAVAAGDDANAELLRNQLKKMREVEKPMPTQLKSPALESPSKQNDVQLIPFKPTITV